MAQKRTNRRIPLIVAFLVVAMLSLTLAPLQPAAQAASSAAGATITADVLNVRSGPGAAYGAIGRAKAGQTFTIVGKSEDGKWWQVDFGGKKGWVSGQWVQVTGATSDVAVVKVAAPPKAAPKAAAAAAPAPRPSAAGFFGYGIQVDPGAIDSAIQGVQGLGFNWVKFQLPWKDFEGGGPGQRNWPDDVIGKLNGSGISILASIVKAPKWARPGNSNFDVEGPPADPGTYASFVGEFAGRYCGRVQAIEVWNEQNLWYEWGGEALDAGRYVRLLAAAYRAIKGACPSMIVVSGAPTPTGATPPAAIRDTTYLEQMYRAGLRSYSTPSACIPAATATRPTRASRISRPGTTAGLRTSAIHRSTSATRWSSTATSW